MNVKRRVFLLGSAVAARVASGQTRLELAVVGVVGAHRPAAGFAHRLHPVDRLHHIVAEQPLLVLHTSGPGGGAPPRQYRQRLPCLPRPAPHFFRPSFFASF